jgi:hypothetical protein
VIEYRRTPSLLELWLSRQGRSDGELAVFQWLDEHFAIPSARYTAP